MTLEEIRIWIAMAEEALRDVPEGMFRCRCGAIAPENHKYRSRDPDQMPVCGNCFPARTVRVQFPED
jgi:hypothetical protein